MEHQKEARERTQRTPAEHASKINAADGVPYQRKEKSTTESGQTHQFQQIANNSPIVTQLKTYQEMADESEISQEATQLKNIANGMIEPPPSNNGSEETNAGEKENKTGLPDDLKTGIEHLSGHSMDDVKVHYNSSQPAQLQAHAYAQGTDIHIASGQEKHLPHEAWHVVQQKQGRVQPTMQMKGKVNVNDDSGLEKEADVMGAKAMRASQSNSDELKINLQQNKSSENNSNNHQVAQLMITINNIDYNPDDQIFRHGFINMAAFNDIQQAVQAEPNFNLYNPQLQNVIQNVRNVDFDGQDVPTVAAEISQQMVNQWQQFNIMIPAPRQNDLNRIVEQAIAANVNPDHAMDMDEAEAAGFDQLAVNAGGDAVMSRAKGTPTPIAHGQLPAAIQGHVTTVLHEINTMENLFTLNAIHPRHFLPHDPTLLTEVFDLIPHYQGNHTNMAGWLPAIGIPVNHLEAVKQAFLNSFTPAQQHIFNAPNPLESMGIGRGLNQTNLGTVYINEFVRQKSLLTNPTLKESIWSYIGNNISGYIEFNIPGAVGRLVYDPMGENLYICAHYKWRNGYNPFFQIN